MMDAKEIRDLMLQAPTRTLPVTVTGRVLGARYVAANAPTRELGSPYVTQPADAQIFTEVLARFSPKGEFELGCVGSHRRSHAGGR